MNILGIIASSTLAAASDFESIATVTVGGGGAANVEFTSIPATYQHLQIRGILRDQRATYGNSGPLVQFNSDTGSNYSWHDIYGDGSSAVARGAANTVDMGSVGGAGGGAPANVFGALVIDILDYADTNKYKTVRYLGGQDQNGAGEIFFGSGLWMNTNAVTQLDITSFTGNSFVQYSSFALYGIKGA